MSTKNLYQRMHAVMNEVGTIAKNGRNEFHRYDYATEADFVHALRPLLDKHGLVIVPSIVGEPVLSAPDEKGNCVTSLSMKFTIVNIDNPEERIESIVPAQGQDKGDKGVYKALTGAKKYFAALTFMVATGDDPEKDEKTGKLAAAKVVTQEQTPVLAKLAETTTTARRPSFRKNVTPVNNQDDI